MFGTMDTVATFDRIADVYYGIKSAIETRFPGTTFIGHFSHWYPWGAMLYDARSHLFDAPQMVVFPALAVMAAVLAFNLLGDALRDWLDPRMRSYLIVASLAR
jgi:ABC-type dipeptide/oligopeptide/nickel transport system permease component